MKQIVEMSDNENVKFVKIELEDPDGTELHVIDSVSKAAIEFTACFPYRSCGKWWIIVERLNKNEHSPYNSSLLNRTNGQRSVS